MKNDYKKICVNLLKGLPSRTSEVLERRFGLKSGKRETLEAIGASHGITRERVRQIENEGISWIKGKAEAYGQVFRGFDSALKNFGGLKKEEALLKDLGGDKLQNEVFFLLNLSEDLQRIPEDKNFYSFWTNKNIMGVEAKKIIDISLDSFGKEKKPLAVEAIFADVKPGVIKILGKGVNEKIFASYLEVSKQVQRNPDGQWGIKNWIEISPRGIKDKAYLVFKKEEKPLHFSRVAALIEQLPFPAKRKVQVAAVHNELIRDPRFILVGRGLYALKEWGYASGVVKDVIFTVLREAKKPLSREEIIQAVFKQRFVKKNTVVLNLQDRNYFLRNSSGSYTINPVREA